MRNAHQRAEDMAQLLKEHLQEKCLENCEVWINDNYAVPLLAYFRSPYKLFLSVKSIDQLTTLNASCQMNRFPRKQKLENLKWEYMRRTIIDEHTERILSTLTEASTIDVIKQVSKILKETSHTQL